MNKKLLIRKAHRYLGLFIGLQFLGWTVSGLYFSWNHIDDVHGDHLRRGVAYLSADTEVVSPTVALANVRARVRVDSVHSVRLVNLLGDPIYQVNYFSGHAGEGLHVHTHTALADGRTGAVRPSLNRAEAIAVAREQIISGANVSEVEFIETTDAHHEYREKPLPAWAITFSDPACTVYVSAEQGTFQSIRHQQWRAFDLLWMFHTMDYSGRDNFNNWLLKALSVFGLLTVLSGFTLYVSSSKRLLRRQD